MTAEVDLVAEVARDVLARPSEDPWAPLVDGEWIGVAVDPEHGGQGATIAEAAALAGAAGATAASIPVLEAILAAIVAGSVPAGRHLVPRLASGDERAILVPAVAHGPAIPSAPVPWARHATVLLVVLARGDERRLAFVSADSIDVMPGTSAAGDPHDRVRLRPGVSLDPSAADLVDRETLLAETGVLTAARLVGAAESIQRMSVAHAKQRRQFGVAIGSFQAVAHSLARQLAEVELACAALDAALDAYDTGDVTPAIAARVTAGDAARQVVRIGHQVHGAIGVTREHDLHRYALRAGAWRDAFGAARSWETLLGGRAAAAPDEFWRTTTPSHA